MPGTNRPWLGRVALVPTRRRMEVSFLLVRGYTNKEIAETLGISERTVEGHVSIVLHALGMTSRMDLILAVGPGLLLDRLTQRPRSNRVPNE